VSSRAAPRRECAADRILLAAITSGPGVAAATIGSADLLAANVSAARAIWAGCAKGVMTSFAIPSRVWRMSTMNVSLPDELKSFVDERVGVGGFGSTSEYVRDLIRRDQERERIRGLLLDGAASPPGPIADSSYFESLRDRVRPGD
jgi:antitoxin ParD1/3/4